jgi:hypothetical protein
LTVHDADLRRELQFRVHRDKSAVSAELLIKTYVFIFCIIMFLKCRSAHIYIRIRIHLQKSAQPSAVVIMSVRKHAELNRRKVCSESRCIFTEQLRLSEVKEDGMTSGLYKKTQTVFLSDIRSAGSIFHQRCDYHNNLPNR